MAQHGLVFKLKATNGDGRRLWAYRYRVEGRGSKRPQVGGFATRAEAQRALKMALARTRPGGRPVTLTVSELVREYLEVHQAAPSTIAKLRWLLSKTTASLGDTRVIDLRSEEICVWQRTLPSGYRFEATQALRQVLARAVAWQIIEVNPARQGVDNPVPRYPEKRPFERWAEIEAIAEQLGPRYGPMIVFAASTGLRPGELVALEHRDVDRAAGVLYVRRAFAYGRVTNTKTRRSVRAVPLQAVALAALDRACAVPGSPLLFPAPEGGHIDIHNFRSRHWRPAQRAVGIDPLRRPYDLRHTFATFALRAGVSIFDLSRYMGASLSMIDRHYGHLARDGRQHAVELLDALLSETAAWTSGGQRLEGHELARPVPTGGDAQGETYDRGRFVDIK
jgi:integrase